MSLIEKIDAEIVRLEKERDLFPRWINPEKHDEANAAVKEAYRIREIIISEQKEPKSIMLTSKSTLTDKPLTIGDKIRESNESLANEIMKFGQRCYDCDYKEKPECNVKSCKDGILEYLNQPYTE